MLEAAHRIGLSPWVAAALCLAVTATAQQVKVQYAMEKNEGYVGESFTFQIQIEGDAAAETPELKGFDDFEVVPKGEHQNSHQAVAFVNGRMTRTVQRTHIYSYQLTPKRAGVLSIPSVQVVVGGRTYTTGKVSFRARQPEESDAFKLRLSLSTQRSYVGEPILLRVTWYLGMDVREFGFIIPILDDNRFANDDVEIVQVHGKEYYRIPVAGAEVIGEKKQARLDGKTYAALTFEKIVIPKQPGAYTFPAAAVTCQALVGRGRSRSTFDDFFSTGRRGIYRSFVTKSEPMTLEVLPLPETGRPKGFTGLVGRYGIETHAHPTTVNVGDPITLTVRVTGSPYIKHFDLPPLGEFPQLAERFKIPVEMAAAKREGAEKVFTQTLRALNDSVTEVPPIELVYFDTRAETYRVAKSAAIPLKVRTTNVLTAADAEGRELPAVHNQLTAWREGIAHNHEDPSVLLNQAYGPGKLLTSPLWITFAGSPPIIYLLLLAGVATRRRDQANPELRRAKKAYAELAGRLKQLGDRARAGESNVFEELLEALRNYVGGKLNVPAGALTHVDAGRALAERGVNEETVAGIQAIFEACETYSYAGGQGAGESPISVVERAQVLAKALDKELK